MDEVEDRHRTYPCHSILDIMVSTRTLPLVAVTASLLLLSAFVSVESSANSKSFLSTSSLHKLMNGQPLTASDTAKGLNPGEDLLTKVLFADAANRNATCNDGTAAGYYIKKSPTGSKSWIIYLEGGGLCYDLDSCATRPKFLTSSTPWPDTLGTMGILGNETSNQFGDWNKGVRSEQV